MHERTVVTSNGNPVLLPSQLGHTLETINVVKNSLANDLLLGNLINANLSTKPLVFTYLMDGEGATEQLIPEKWYPGVVGERTIIVRQEADDTYEAGMTSFRMKVVEPQSGTQTSDFAVAVYNVPRGNSTSQGWDDANDHTVYLPEGTTLTLNPHHHNTPGTVIVTAFDNGNMNGVSINKRVGETITDNVTVAAQNLSASGIATLTLHYSGDATYAPKDVIYTIKVASTTTHTIKVVSSEVGSVVGWYLNKADGEDRLKLNQNYGQPWVFEQVPGQSGYYYLYNLNNSVYLRLGDDNSWSPTLSSSLNPGDKGTFLIEYVSGGVRLKRTGGGYIGTSSTDGGYVYLNKDANSATWQLIPN